jgi:hypothetical protein
MRVTVRRRAASGVGVRIVAFLSVPVLGCSETPSLEYADSLLPEAAVEVDGAQGSAAPRGGDGGTVVGDAAGDALPGDAAPGDANEGDAPMQVTDGGLLCGDAAVAS